MASISMAKVLGPQGVPPRTRSLFAIFSRRRLSTLVTIIFIIQAIVLYRLFIYEPALPKISPYSTARTVALVTEWYERLRDMHYIDPGAIAYPPHVGNEAINVTLARQMGLDERVIDTMLQMPYISGHTSVWMLEHDSLYREGHFIDGRFVDYRNVEDIYSSRDPLGHWFISDSKSTPKFFEQSMMDYDVLFPKSALPLSIVREKGMSGKGNAIVIDTATNRLHMMSTEDGDNQDPFFDHFLSQDTIPLTYKIKTPFYGPTIQYARSIEQALNSFIMSLGGRDFYEEYETYA